MFMAKYDNLYYTHFATPFFGGLSSYQDLKIEADNLFRCCDDENETEAESLLVHMIEIDDMIEQIENVAEVLR